MSDLSALFVRNARERMAELKINQAEIGRRLQVTSATVSTILSLKNTPTLDTVEKWAEALETTASRLLLDELEPAPEAKKLRLIGAIITAKPTILDAVFDLLGPSLESEEIPLSKRSK